MFHGNYVAWYPNGQKRVKVNSTSTVMLVNGNTGIKKAILFLNNKMV